MLFFSLLMESWITLSTFTDIMRRNWNLFTFCNLFFILSLFLFFTSTPHHLHGTVKTTQPRISLTYKQFNINMENRPFFLNRNWLNLHKIPFFRLRCDQQNKNICIIKGIRQARIPVSRYIKTKLKFYNHIGNEILKKSK